MTPGDLYLDSLDTDPSAGQPKTWTAEEERAAIVRYMRKKAAACAAFGERVGLNWTAQDIERGEHLKESDHE